VSVSYLPVSGLVAGWLSACLAGRSHPEEMLHALGEDTLHLVAGVDEAVLSLVLAIGALRRRGATAAALALPVPGDLAGLAGPPEFNDRVLEEGEAVLVLGAGLGLVPEFGDDVVTWHAVPAERPRPVDPQEAGATLRTTLVEATHRLVELDVARWQPEIADALSNLQHRSPAPLPPHFSASRVATVERAALCREIVALADAGEGGAVSAFEIDARRAALGPLDRAARHALVAACSG
jgi:hypothetical protein